VSTGCSNLERFGTLALFVNVDGLSRLHTERWTVNALTIHQDVTVNNHLTSLGNGTCETGAKN
jgi:hypothetical protein